MAECLCGCSHPIGVEEEKVLGREVSADLLVYEGKWIFLEVEARKRILEQITCTGRGE